jgi:hypothetical protein
MSEPKSARTRRRITASALGSGRRPASIRGARGGHTVELSRVLDRAEHVGCQQPLNASALSGPPDTANDETSGTVSTLLAASAADTNPVSSAAGR